MAVLTISWQNPGRVAPEGTTVTTPAEGTTPEGAAEAPAPRRADKPMLVYVADPTATEGFDKVEKVVLTDDKVAVGCKAFTCIRITPEQAAQDAILSKAGKETPRFVFISADYKSVEVLEGSKLSIGGLFGEMKTQFKKHYSGDLEKNVKALIKILGEFDKLANERSQLEEKKAREEKPSPADQNEWKKTAEELDAREKAANGDRDKLLKFEPKPVA